MKNRKLSTLVIAATIASSLLSNTPIQIGPTGSLAVAWRGIALSFTHNHYGTRSNHITLGWRAPLAR